MSEAATLKVLIVDDEAPARERLRSLLAEIADVAALDGIHAARQIAAALRGRGPAATPEEPDRASELAAHRVPLTAEPPLAWISPNAIRFPAERPGATSAATPPPRGRFLLRSQVFRRRALLEVRQGGRILGRDRARLIPGRPVILDSGWLARADPCAGPVRVHVA